MMMEKQKRDQVELDGPKSRITALCSMVSRHCNKAHLADHELGTSRMTLTWRWLHRFVDRVAKSMNTKRESDGMCPGDRNPWRWPMIDQRVCSLQGPFASHSYFKIKIQEKPGWTLCIESVHACQSHTHTHVPCVIYIYILCMQSPPKSCLRDI